MTADVSPVGDIVIGERDRTDLGDIDGLAASITEVGLLHPIVVTASHDLVAGRRRLAAVESLGWTEVPVTVVDLTNVADVLRAEAAENTCRKSLTPTEAERLRERIKSALEPAAKKRQGTRTDLTSSQVATKSDTAKVAAVPTGYSPRTLDKVTAVRTVAGNRKLPKPIRDLAAEALADMDRTGKVDGPAKKVAEVVAEHERDDVDKQVDAWIGDGAAVQRSAYRRRVVSAMTPLTNLPLFDAELVAAVLDDSQHQLLEEFLTGINTWADKVRHHRRTLRVVNGGQS